MSPVGSTNPDFSNPLVQGRDYTVSYQPDSTGTMVLQVKFVRPNPITRPYMLRFRVIISAAPGETSTEISNSVSITYGNNITVPGTGGGESTVDIGSGGGWMQGNSGELILFKVGDDVILNPLRGAVFQLFDTFGRPVGTPVTTGPDGTITFKNLLYGDTSLGYPPQIYIVKEIKAPPGHGMVQELQDGMTILVDESPFELILTNPLLPVPPGGGNSATGDYSNMIVWQLALLASALGLICIMMWRRRDKLEKQ